MAGVTFEADLEDATGFTFGVGYERRLRAWYGLGGFAQWTFGGPRSFVVGPAFTMHPTDPIRVTMAVPAEISTTSLTIFYRLELGYEFRLAERWVLAPSVAADLGLGRRVLLFGASVGRPSGALAPKKS